ncbi:hypothetical protein JTB14_002728 [Gonioctena quinquepunctata]|nr:hypothetical protein JTB14_002728 [Gonioctena quinquepunctata]
MTLSENEDFHKDLNLDCDNKIQRILGLSWNSKFDTFCFKLEKLKENDDFNRPTKRQVLKTAMSIFDPLGLIVNFTIKARILIQDIWRSSIGCDDYIDGDLNV